MNAIDRSLLLEPDLDPSQLLVIDLFAGGGGASEGIRRALGRGPDYAVNHDLHAIRMHEQNHPESRHYRDDVFSVDPEATCEGRRPDLLWASPDCTHFSRAKGGKPKSKKIRGLAWVVVRWATTVQPRVIALENVPEFLTWGPLHPDGHPKAGHPDKSRGGETFAEWIRCLERAGYVVEWRTIKACDHGARTTRKRLYLIARSDGVAIRWAEQTHGKGLLPYRTAAECIDWTIPIPSIFLSPKEAKAWAKAAKKLHPDAAKPKRPLAEKTLRRVAEGVRRYVLGDRRPFLVKFSQNSVGQGLGEPIHTVMAGAPRFAVVAPTVVAFDHQGSGDGATWAADEPIGTVTSKARHAVAAATLIQTGYGEAKGQTPRALDIEAPLGTVVATGQKHALIAAFVAKHNLKVVGQGAREPLHTITGTDTKALVACSLIRFYGSSTGEASVEEPLATVRAQGNHAALVAAFLCKYYGSGGQWAGMDEPLHTATGHARFSLVTVEIDGAEWAIVDIGMRMLTPRELARAQGFPDSYVLTGTKTEKVARIGNSVCPDVAEAIVRALFPDHAAAREELAA